MAAQTLSALGPLVRLEGISINQLPPGGKGIEPSTKTSSSEKWSDGSGVTAAPTLQAFITNVITEAVPFIDGMAPKSGGETTWKKKGAPKRFSSTETTTQVYEFVVPGKELNKVQGMSPLTGDNKKDETWFGRRSCHKNKAEKGTASWEEFVYAFKEHHHETEDAFTPTVIGAREAIHWDTSTTEVNAHGGRWVNTSVHVVEMTHQINPKPLKNRTFPVVQVAAVLAGAPEFLVISIPLTDFNKSPYCEYARDKSLVMAAYASIERVRLLPSNDEVEWIMATASDAGGVLPQWMQNMTVPGLVAKDVDMFMAWMPSRRADESQKPPVSMVASTADKSLPKAPEPSETASTTTAPPPPISKTAEEQRPNHGRSESANKSLPAAPTQ